MKTYKNLCDTYPAPDTLWSTELGQPPAGPPLVVGDLLLAPTQEHGLSSHHAMLHALSAGEASPRWQRPFEYALVSGLAQTSKVSETLEVLALVAATSTDLMRGEGALVALDAAGEERYRWSPGVQRVSAPAVCSDDFSRLDTGATKVATTNSGDLACFTADARTLVVLDLATGAERRRVGLEASASLAAPILAGDVAYVPCRGPRLLAVGLDGRPRWRFDAEKPPDVWLDKTPVVVGEHLFAVLSTGAVLALRMEDGSLAWRMDVGPEGKRLSPPATDGERLYIGARDGLHALALADGRKAWTFSTPRRIVAAPVVTGGVVYATCHDHRLYALDAATGRELWRYEVERRIEVSPVVATCGELAQPCVLVADRSGVLTAVVRPLNAEALEEHARSLAGQPFSDEVRAAAWAAAAGAFDVEGEMERVAACQREAARCLRQPVVTLDVEHEGLALDAWSRLQFIVRNEGYGPARNFVIRATGDEFEGQVTATRRITMLRAGQDRTDWLDVRPREYGQTVPLRVSVEYEDQAGELCSHEHTIYIAVARSKATRREGERITILGKDVERPRERDLASLRRQLEEARESLRLIRERQAEYVMGTDVPLDLVKRERQLEQQIADLEALLE